MPTKKSPKKLLWLVLHLIKFVNSAGVFWVWVKALRPVSNVVTPLDSIEDEYDNEYEIFSVLSSARA